MVEIGPERIEVRLIEAMALIQTKGIEKSYKTGAGETFVLRRIDLEVEAGDFITIMGPSGAGKSTLLSILGMLDGDWRGEYWLAGEPAHAMKPRARIELNKRYVGFVFQQYHLLDDLTVYENLEIPLSYRNVKRKERQAIVADSLDRFQIVGKKADGVGVVEVDRGQAGEHCCLLLSENWLGR